MNQSPRYLRLSRSIVGLIAAFLLCAITVAAQSRIIRPTQPNSTTAARRQHVATLRASDSAEGSRVAVSADQSLNDYEAYRRGDRFYVRIPPSDVPRAETVRGRGFADVKAQKSGDSTVVSFRLQPGATAHVEQRGNKLDVVFTVPGARTLGASNPNSSSRSNTGAEANRKSAEQKNAAAHPENQKALSASNKKDSATRNSTGSSPIESNSSKSSATANPAKSSASKAAATPESLASTATPELKSNATPESSARPSPTAKPSASVTPKGSTTTSSSATQSTPASGRGDETSQGIGSVKERIRYWILLAQLNPVPVAIGLGILLLLIALLILQRLRAKGTRVRSSRVESRPGKPAPESVPTVKPAEAKAEVASAAAISGAAAAAAAATGAAAMKDSKPETASPTKVAPGDGLRRERVTQVAEQAKKVLAGEQYDQSVIGSPDRETRQLVGAELLTGLVGRDAVRRERAREAFMKYGYFEDATRDLRVAESANERAAAARRLNFVHDREATPHLIGALHDSSPDVRRAAVEALMDLRDPSAIGPLNNLMQTENDRKVPRTLIKHAIDACATSPTEPAPPGVSSSMPTTAPEPAPPPIEHEREVIEL